MSSLSSCYLFKAIKYKNFELKYINDFITDTIQKPGTSFYFKQASSTPAYLKTMLDTNLANSNTFSFLVIRNDTILYENYWEGVNQTTLLPSFSVSKSFISTLIAIAWKEGYIKHLYEPITHYIPELLKRDQRFANITIQHLLDMRSGIKSDENYYNPSSDVLKMGFGNNIWNQIKKLKIEKPPGDFEYKSVNTQLLAFILERATGKKTQDYFYQKIWKPLGMESYATWNIDSKKHRMVRAFCCLNATTRDYAKLGRLYLENGVFEGVQLLPAEWVTCTTQIDSMVLSQGYKNQWWSNEYSISFRDSLQALNYIRKTPHCEPNIFVYNRKEDKERGIKAARIYYVYYLKEAYHAEGLLGQYIYVHPKKNLIIVRTGHYWQHKKHAAADHFIYDIGEKYF